MKAIEKVEMAKAKVMSKLQGHTASGGVFTVEFKKVNGEDRQMCCILASNSGRNIKDSNSYVTVVDLMSDEFRTINLDTLKRVVLKHQVITVV